MPGYKYRLYNTDGDEVGEYNTLAWNWTVGDVLEMHSDQGRWRIVRILDLDESDDSSGQYQAAFQVEPADEGLAAWFCSCEGPDGMVAHPADEETCSVCGDRLPGRA